MYKVNDASSITRLVYADADDITFHQDQKEIFRV